MKPYAVGIDVGGTKIAAGVLDRSMNVLSVHVTKEHAGQLPAQVVDAIERAYWETLKQAQVSPSRHCRNRPQLRRTHRRAPRSGSHELQHAGMGPGPVARHRRETTGPACPSRQRHQPRRCGRASLWRRARRRRSGVHHLQHGCRDGNRGEWQALSGAHRHRRRDSGTPWWRPTGAAAVAASAAASWRTPAASRYATSPGSGFRRAKRRPCAIWPGMTLSSSTAS